MSLEEEIVAAEQRRCDAIVRADARQLRECLDEALIYVHSNGVVEDRETYIAKLVSGERKYLAFQPGSRTIRRLGTAVACVGEMEVRSSAGVVSLVVTTVYERRGDWRMVLWHSCATRRT